MRHISSYLDATLCSARVWDVTFVAKNFRPRVQGVAPQGHAQGEGGKNCCLAQPPRSLRIRMMAACHLVRRASVPAAARMRRVSCMVSPLASRPDSQKSIYLIHREPLMQCSK